MSTKTKKPRISEESRRKLQEFETTQQLYNELDEFKRQTSNATKRAKDQMARTIADIGGDFVEDLEKKEKEAVEKQRREEEKYREYAGKVEFIIKNTGDHHGTLENLNSMTYQQIDSIYNKVLEESKKGFWSKLFDFLMGW